MISPSSELFSQNPNSHIHIFVQNFLRKMAEDLSLNLDGSIVPKLIGDSIIIIDHDMSSAASLTSMLDFSYKGKEMTNHFSIYISVYSIFA